MRLTFLLIASLISFPSTGEIVKCKDDKSYPVHLTFDDGPKIPETLVVLEKLAKASPPLKATFFISTERFRFVLTKRASDYSDREKQLLEILKLMKTQGHLIGNHSFKHIHHGNADEYSETEVSQNLEKSFEVWDKLGLNRPAPFRFPYGGGWFIESKAKNEKMRQLALEKVRKRGFVPVHWDMDSWDWSKIKRKSLPASLLQQICTHQGGVALFHDVHPSTAQNIDSLITSIRRAGHRLVDFSNIKHYSDRRGAPLFAFKDSVVGLNFCRQKPDGLDQIWGSCSELEKKSFDREGKHVVQ